MTQALELVKGVIKVRIDFFKKMAYIHAHADACKKAAYAKMYKELKKESFGGKVIWKKKFKPAKQTL